jgi:hypothetical protein
MPLTPEYTGFVLKIDEALAQRAAIEYALALAIGPDAARTIANILTMYMVDDPSRPLELQLMDRALRDYTGYTRPATPEEWPLDAKGTTDAYLTNKLAAPALGKFQIICLDQGSASRIITLKFLACGQTTTYTLPDPGTATTQIMVCDAAQTITAIKTFTAQITLANVDIGLGTGAGTKIGTSVAHKLGFHNATPVAQRSGAAQAAVAATAATNSSPYGYAQSQADAIVTLLNEIRACLVEKGLMKGSA